MNEIKLYFSLQCIANHFAKKSILIKVDDMCVKLYKVA